MARIKLGPVVTDIAGSIGGTTIQRNKFGYSIRSKPLPLHSETSAQYNIREKIVLLQHSWQALTDAQRLQWTRFLDFSGQTINRDRSILLSGHTLYLKYQLWRLINGLSLLTTISYSPMPTIVFPTKLTLSGNYFYLYFPSSIVVSSYFFAFKLTTPRGQQQAFNRRGLRFIKAPYVEQSTFLITDPYIAVFGALPPLNSWHHFSITYFSITSPVYSGIYTGKLQTVTP